MTTETDLERVVELWEAERAQTPELRAETAALLSSLAQLRFACFLYDCPTPAVLDFDLVELLRARRSTRLALHSYVLDLTDLTGFGEADGQKINAAIDLERQRFIK